ncbi:UPF0280 family protein [Pelotomaculum terephthalicicum JT]|uniref:UPF0280 family protein n=1 Tax=Pelotomaculum TaxID=191373 RepID=UPI0009D1FE31|nr:MULTISPECIES: UPF0280 family protein [Pelotomaculum]MCG9968112.1 UPF0280 family protein [Pelotomaculum terephthalicicum JT]OPX87868.1 MAG: hypothetical protein A4E54_01451 [Pelotomaculum sp. PtaB.Bin117]
MDYVDRSYRRQFRQEDLTYFQVVVRQTDLSVGVRRDRFSLELTRWVEEIVREQRILLENYIESDPVFLQAMEPHAIRPDAPPIAADMADAARIAGVGPMAAVAGAFAQYVGRALVRRSKDVIVENGGDIFLRSTRQRRIGVFAGSSALSNRIALEIMPEDTPVGICTSSGTVGPSLSLGKADAAVILSPSAILADAVATTVGNLVQSKEDIQAAVEFAVGIDGITGALIIKDDHLAACGRLKLVPLTV